MSLSLLDLYNMVIHNVYAVIYVSLVAAGWSGFWSTLLLILVEENPLIINPIDDTLSSVSFFFVLAKLKMAATKI